MAVNHTIAFVRVYAHRTLIEGDSTAGFSIFWADDGLDTGPLLLTRQCQVEATDTLDTLYKRFLYPVGIEAMGEAVDLIAAGKAPKIVQPQHGATYDPAMFKEENQQINLHQSAERIFNFIRALDSVPGAIAYVENPEDSSAEPELVRLFGATVTSECPSKGVPLHFKGLKSKAIVHSGGILITGTDGGYVNVQRIKKGNRVIDAGKWFDQNTKQISIELTESEKQMCTPLRNIWESILKVSVTDETDFFACGAGSMDVVRLVEEVKDTLEVPIENEHLFMAPVFLEFFHELIKASRGHGVTDGVTVYYDGFILNENKRQISIATQLFINGKFVDAENGQTLDIVNPSTEEVLCKVSAGTAGDVNEAVEAANAAFHGEWSQMSARQRGAVMFRLADLMEQHKEELATIEAADSGAVYTLALKTHIGMSIDAWRYFAGWTDKIQGSTIPVSAARPNKVLTFTKREPIGYGLLQNVLFEWE